jgi:hypothetical protein
MIEGGADPVFIVRRLCILASEDIGLADPNAMVQAAAAAEIRAANRHARRFVSVDASYDLPGARAQIECSFACVFGGAQRCCRDFT